MTARTRRRLFSMPAPPPCLHLVRTTFLALALLLPLEARGQELIGRSADTALLATGATLSNLAGLLPAVGSGIGVAYETPNRRWAIAGTVVGGAQVTLGALSIASGLAERRDVWLATYGAATVLLGAGNLILGVINLFKSHRAERQFELLDAPYWAVAPLGLGRGAYGLGLAIGERSPPNEAWPDSAIIE
jgi:hypothetical protein